MTPEINTVLARKPEVEDQGRIVCHCGDTWDTWDTDVRTHLHACNSVACSAEGPMGFSPGDREASFLRSQMQPGSSLPA